MRKPFVCGNWKLHHHLHETTAFIENLIKEIEKYQKIEIAVAPVATVLFAAAQKAQRSSLNIAAQNVFFENDGAFTGEWSVKHLTELGVRYVIVGHSERRQYFNEATESVVLKTKASFLGGATPIVCIGESLEEREEGKTAEVLIGQLNPVLDVLSLNQAKDLIVAYEPIWAIGTGKTASKENIEEVHLLLRDCLKKHFGSQISNSARLIYGGSVKPENAGDLIKVANVDGFLVGGASLEVQSFLSILRNAQNGL